MYIHMCACFITQEFKDHLILLVTRVSVDLQLVLLLLLLDHGIYLLTLLQKDMSLCAPIQDNQVIPVLMPLRIFPPAPWPLSSVKSYLPSGLYRVFHSFIIYLQCPTHSSLVWHLTKKNLMVRYFCPHIHLRSTFCEPLWEQWMRWILRRFAPGASFSIV